MPSQRAFSPESSYHLTEKGTRRLAGGREKWRHFVSVIGGILGAQA
jgi:hypothetical protein